MTFSATPSRYRLLPSPRRVPPLPLGKLVVSLVVVVRFSVVQFSLATNFTPVQRRKNYAVDHIGEGDRLADSVDEDRPGFLIPRA